MKSSILIALLLPCCCLPLNAIEIADHTAAENDRFANDPAFIGSIYDWSGIGRDTLAGSGKGGHWATMISSNVFLTANHYHPTIGGTLYFYSDNNPASTPISRVVDGAQRIGSTDLWIGHLDSTLPNTVSYYNWANTTLTDANYSSSIIADENALVTGITPTNTGYGADRKTSIAVGRNIIDGFSSALTVGGTTAPAIYSLQDLSGDSNYQTHETQLVGGDSGAPLFIDVAGDLQLAGINWAIGQVDIKPGPQEELRDISFYSYVGNYSSDIQNYVDANAATPAPEPSVALSLLAGIIVLSFKRRRHRSPGSDA